MVDFFRHCFLPVTVGRDPDSTQEILFSELLGRMTSAMQKRQHGYAAEIASAPSFGCSGEGGEDLLTRQPSELFLEHGQALISVWQFKGDGEISAARNGAVHHPVHIQGCVLDDICFIAQPVKAVQQGSCDPQHISRVVAFEALLPSGENAFRILPNQTSEPSPG
jgi:hypothetical protein